MKTPKEKAAVDDTFAHIAQKVGLKIGGLKENPPEPPSEVILPSGPYRQDHDFVACPRPADSSDLRQGLALLRKNMEPFLKKVAPSLPKTRERIFVRQANWRLGGPGDVRFSPSEIAATGCWQEVTLPHYGGPIGPATAYYCSTINLPAVSPHKRLFLRFQGADYKAHVFLNGAFLLQHEGFFDPFETDVTEVALPGKNVLFVRLDNDFIANGNEAWGQKGNGNKIYAATGLGWDEPGLGWHHCPPGMGLHDQVYFEIRPAVYVEDLWARPLPHEEQVELHVCVHNSARTSLEIDFNASVVGSNFEMSGPQESGSWASLEPGPNHFKLRMAVPAFRLWNTFEPWLYEGRITIGDSEQTLDTISTTFGMRTFVISEEGEEKGRIFLNGEEIRLRGANTMGHEQQCVFHGDIEQLHEDILIARFAGLNFLRITQRPVQQEIYDACDRLGMMVQTDLPLFGKVPRAKFAEVVRQAGAMERLIRGHASCVFVSLINEPFPLAWGNTTHRHLARAELERLLRACGEIIRYENPDRQIKPVDGDYDPPADGLPDNHCYCGWYAGHAIDLGKLHRGHWLPTKPGWRYACGEFGSEGLESAKLMQSRYPKEWLPKPGEEDSWHPSIIARAQTGHMHGLWMEAGRTRQEWIENSQEHQKWITRLMTRAFRRDARMSSFAIHLLIDAFPAGWMKTLVDCERNPKPAYFAYKEALEPLLVDARMDRWGWWGGESLSAELWICHDLSHPQPGCSLRYVVEVDNVPIASGTTPSVVPICSSRCAGRLQVALPEVSQRAEGRIRAALVSADGATLNDVIETFTVFPTLPTGAFSKPLVRVEDEDEIASQFCAGLGIPNTVKGTPTPGEIIISSNPEVYSRVEKAVREGATLLLLQLPPGTYGIEDQTISCEIAGFGPRHFVSRNTGHRAVSNLERNDFRFWYDPQEDSVTSLLDTVVLAEGWTPILASSQAGWKIAGHYPAHACAERRVGKGRVIVCQAKLANRTATNPPASIFLQQLLA